jgi:ABC-type branched-subunit amino acid transport system substrate-binding protein
MSQIIHFLLINASFLSLYYIKHTCSIGAAEVGNTYVIPQVSFASTSTSLSSRETYPYFARTCLPDDIQALGIVDVIFASNLTYVSVISSDDSYSTNLATSFINE